MGGLAGWFDALVGREVLVVCALFFCSFYYSFFSS